MFHRLTTIPPLCLLLMSMCPAAGSVATEPAGLSAAPPPLPYELSAYELAPQFQWAGTWAPGQIAAELAARLAREKQRKEMDIFYYRIGYRVAFPLALKRRPKLEDLPAPITSKYPWLIWYAWDLEERWRLLHFAWRTLGDQQAGALLQEEMAALADWDRFAEVNEGIGLVTGHLAASLSVVLPDTAGWDRQRLAAVRTAASQLIERDVHPWFQSQWNKKEIGPRDLANIPVIALVRAAQLARVIGSSRCAALDETALAALRAWCRLRLGKERHTEGTAYDGYLMDSVTEWLEALPDASAIRSQSRDALRDLAVHFIGMTLPARPDLQTPLGDVEPEMTFWATVLFRLHSWYQWADAAWLLTRFPPARMRVPALLKALEFAPASKSEMPATDPLELPNAIVLRTGWSERDVLAAVGLSRGNMGHLHADGGQVTLGWQRRFWIVDPGYQQYRAGEEREYTLGPQAHNAPVIGGQAQSLRAARLLRVGISPEGWHHARLDLTRCYRKLPGGASVQREVWLLPGTEPALVVEDQLKSLDDQTDVATSWQAGTHLAWSFVDGWARLSDGRQTLWLGTFPGSLQVTNLARHPGSRGPLTLTHSYQPAGTLTRRWWFMCGSRAGNWTPPQAALTGSRLILQSPEKRLLFNMDLAGQDTPQR